MLHLVNVELHRFNAGAETSRRTAWFWQRSGDRRDRIQASTHKIAGTSGAAKNAEANLAAICSPAVAVAECTQSNSAAVNPAGWQSGHQSFSASGEIGAVQSER